MTALRIRKFFTGLVRNFFHSTFEELRTTFYLFRKESVFKYFLAILFLSVLGGILFAYFEYGKIIAANPDIKELSFFDQVVTALYWATVTLATVGYGDIFPSTQYGRIFVMIFILTSTATVALFTANLASALTTKKILERLKGKGLAMLRKQKGLFVVCGWKRHMDTLIKEMIKINDSLRPEDFVIIADISEEQISKFKTDPALEKVNVVQGAYHTESVLRNVNLMDSKKVMVLADREGNETEADSRTVMTVITVKAIAPKAYVCAEILNSNYENYLRMSLCDEIILITEYLRILLAKASHSAGIAHVIQELLDSSSPHAFLVTENVPEPFINKPYSELKEHVYRKTKNTIIGLLENTGTVFEMKRHAIREAQKIADMTKLVENLNQLKSLQGNRPRLNPPDDYLIARNTMAIYIKNSLET